MRLDVCNGTDSLGGGATDFFLNKLANILNFPGAFACGACGCGACAGGACACGACACTCACACAGFAGGRDTDFFLKVFFNKLVNILNFPGAFACGACACGACACGACACGACACACAGFVGGFL